MAFGDKVKWEKETADNTVPAIVGTPLHHATFPKLSFDASLFEPVSRNGWPLLMPPVPAAIEAARLKELEAEAADELTPEAKLGIKTLVEVASNKFMSESARVRAAMALLERFDARKAIDALKAEIAELKKAGEQAAEDSELPPSLRRKG